MQSRCFRAMGTTITLYGPESDVFGAATALTQGIFETEEQRFSRFRSTSELSAINAAAGVPTLVSDRFAQVVGLALEARDRTEGLFDPTILRPLMAAGYDRDIDEVRASPTQGALETIEPPTDTDVSLDGNTLRIEAGAGLDLGGIAKGWTADRAAEAAATMLGWAMVDAGGDMRLAGGDGLVVAIEDPWAEGEPLTHLTLENGALATSSTLRRRWGTDRHHIIDPRTSVPSDTGVVQATAWGPTCAEAEVNAKWALLTGRKILDRVGALLLMEGGEIITNLPCGLTPTRQREMA